jgi:hypothetical protein
LIYFYTYSLKNICVNVHGVAIWFITVFVQYNR